MCDQQSLRSAWAYAQSDQSLCLLLEYSVIVKLLTEHHFEFLSLKGGCRVSSESTHVKMPHCWKSHVLAQIVYLFAKTCSIFHQLQLASHNRLSLVFQRRLIFQDEITSTCQTARSQLYTRVSSCLPLLSFEKRKAKFIHTLQVNVQFRSINSVSFLSQVI